ncbi:hypothetical protein V2J09_003107 [Rumex salicifolius]
MVKKFLSSLPRKKFIHIVASLEQAYEERVADEDDETQGEQDKLMYANLDNQSDQPTQDQTGFNGERGRSGQGRGRGRGRGRSNGTKDLSKIQCFKCDKFGHYASSCPDRLLKLQETQANDQNDSQEADSLLMNERTETKCLHLNSSQDKSAVWHARLGHLGKDALKIMMTKELVTGIPRLEVTKELLFDPATRRIVVSRNVEFCEDQNWEWSKSGGDSQGKFGNFKLRLEDIENRDPENSSEEDEIGECDSGNRSNEELSENEGDIKLPSEQLDAPRRSQRMSDLGGLTYYLGIEVSQQRGRIALKQEAYAKKILSEAGMGECNSSHGFFWFWVFDSILKISSTTNTPKTAKVVKGLGNPKLSSNYAPKLLLKSISEVLRDGSDHELGELSEDDSNAEQEAEQEVEQEVQQANQDVQMVVEEDFNKESIIAHSLEQMEELVVTQAFQTSIVVQPSGQQVGQAS